MAVSPRAGCLAEQSSGVKERLRVKVLWSLWSFSQKQQWGDLTGKLA